MYVLVPKIIRKYTEIVCMYITTDLIYSQMWKYVMKMHVEGYDVNGGITSRIINLGTVTVT